MNHTTKGRVARPDIVRHISPPKGCESGLVVPRSGGPGSSGQARARPAGGGSGERSEQESAGAERARESAGIAAARGAARDAAVALREVTDGGLGRPGG